MKETSRRTKQCIGNYLSLGWEESGITETPRAVTPFGGLVRVFRVSAAGGLLRSSEAAFAVSSHFSQRHRPRGDLHGLSACGGGRARRFAHTCLLRADVALHGCWGSLASGRRHHSQLVPAFRARTVPAFFLRLVELQLERLPECSSGYSLDLDSTVFERYGRQQGALRGPTRASMDGPRITAGGGAGRKRIFYCTAGCAAATAARPAA